MQKGVYCALIRRILSLYSEYEEETIMYEQTNPSIKCSVNSCTYHKNQHCTLNEIQVGCCAENVGKPEGTECASFKLGDHGTKCGC